MIDPLSPQTQIGPAEECELDTVRALLREYEASLAIDLCFQGFEDELRRLPGEYAPPGGALLVARAGGELTGCVGVRPLEPEVAELKRLYVRPAGRGGGTGRLLAETAVAEARRLGYERIRLDTLPEMAAAIALYERLGFRDIPPYRENPVSGARFLELALTSGV